MALKNWELIYNPGDRDKNRWELKLKINKTELAPFIADLPGTVGRPFDLDEKGFNFGVFIYEMKEEEFVGICKKIKVDCSEGRIVITGKPEEQLDKMLAKARKDCELPVLYNETGDQAEVPENSVDGSSAEKDADSKEDYDSIKLNSRYTFEEFVIGPNNRFTAAAAQAVAENLSKIYNPFFIYGGVGLGKTHLMNAIGNSVKKKNKDARIIYVTTEKFMSDVIDSIRMGTLKKMRDYYRKLDLLLVDDIQFLEESESTQEEFFHTFNVLHQNGKQIVITSDKPPKQLTTLEDRLRSRFEWGLIADIKSPNLETRVAILKRKGEKEKVNLDDNILLYIASKLKSNIRELEGFLKRINAYASLTHQEVNMDLVRTIMSDLLPEEESVEQEQAAAPQQSKVYVIKSQPQSPASQAAPDARVAPQSQGTSGGQAVQPPPSQAHSQPVKAPNLPVQKSASLSEDELVVISKSPHPPVQPQKPPQPETPPAPTLNEAESQDSGLKLVEVVFFYPEGKEAGLTKIQERFKEVIKKHKLKFQLKGVFEHAYSVSGKIDYNVFTELCKKNNVKIAIVLGPSPDSSIEPDDFANILASVMDEQQISLQLVPWSDLNKDYRYLNLALDITLLKHHG